MVAGNVTEDQAPDGGWIPGGPALYSARQAFALGHEVTLVTSLPCGYDTAVFAGLRLRALRAATAPRYANRYAPGGERVQNLLAPGESLAASEIDAVLAVDACDLLVLAPAYHELAAPPARGARVTGVALQGLLRSTGVGAQVVPHPRPWAQVAPFMRRGWFAFLSEEDAGDAGALALSLADAGVTTFVTHGWKGATCYAPGAPARAFPAIDANPIEPTGAGDCFATSFLVRHAETGDHDASVAFALAAGALATEGRGPLGVPGRSAIEARLRQVAA